MSSKQNVAILNVGDIGGSAKYERNVAGCNDVLHSASACAIGRGKRFKKKMLMIEENWDARKRAISMCGMNSLDVKEIELVRFEYRSLD